MKKKDLEKLGLTTSPAIKEAINIASRAGKYGFKNQELKNELTKLIANPEEYLNHDLFAILSRLVLEGDKKTEYKYQNINYKTYGADIDIDAHKQMENACELPISVAAALMPDAHVGYGLPIGGVLATENSVIPYAVGVDIACRVKLTVFDIPATEINRLISPLSDAIEKNTRFGIGASFSKPKNHAVLDTDWSFSKYVNSLKDIASRQLGTSGSGNHFVEFGEFSLLKSYKGIPEGNYLGLVSHSGSRGSGAKIADHFSRLARSKHPDLPNRLKHLAWLSLDDEDGVEYWSAMSLMGEYASANHYLIHRDIAKAVGGEVLFQVENHHNFAWKEIHGDKEVIVHRKGATPAAKGQVGYIPGTMVASGFLVEGTGAKEALNSCSHGAGRAMSRKAAKQKITPSGLKAYAMQHNVTLLDAGLDEAPLAYKDIYTVMAAQKELVSIIGEFKPRIVKMAPEGERPED